MLSLLVKSGLMPNPWQTYIDDVLFGKRIAGRLERLAVERFLRLCEKEEYYFDEETATLVLEILGNLRHTKGKYYGKRWQLLPWQAFFFAYIFVLEYKSSGLRVVRKVLLCMAKKGGKSEVGGALGVASVRTPSAIWRASRMVLSVVPSPPNPSALSSSPRAAASRMYWGGSVSTCRDSCSSSGVGSGSGSILVRVEKRCPTSVSVSSHPSRMGR